MGPMADSRLSWTSHVTSLEKKLWSANYVINRVRKLRVESSVLMAYHALFGSHLSYGIALWGATSR